MRPVIILLSSMPFLIGTQAWAYPALDAFKICAGAYYANPTNRVSVQYFIDSSVQLSVVWKHCVPPANATPNQRRAVEQARSLFGGKGAGISNRDAQALYRDIYQWMSQIGALELDRGANRQYYTPDAAEKIKTSLINDRYMPSSWANQPSAAPAKPAGTAPEKSAAIQSAGCKPRGVWGAIRDFLSE